MPRLSPATERALQQLKAYQAEVTSDFALGVMSEGPVTCHKNCNHCCHYPLYITPLEGMMIYRWMTENRRWSRALRERLVATDEQTWRLSVEIWLLSNIPCPLLGGDGLCQGYTCRPTVCRTVYSRGEADLCHPHRFLRAPLVSRRDVMERWSRIEQGVLKQPLTALPLSTAVLLGERICKGDVDLRDCNPMSVGGLRKW